MKHFDYIGLGFCSNDHLAVLPFIPMDTKVKMVSHAIMGGGPAATASESFGRDGLLEAPQYTHPPEFRGMKVPGVLLSGDHAKIEAWRRAEARKLTERTRPDLAEGGRAWS